jgi:predicted SnoaL-like aldol condensation-catalyzing enzyme
MYFLLSNYDFTLNRYKIYAMKNVIIILTILFIVNACNSKQGDSANEKLVKQFFEYFNTHDWNKMASMYADTTDFKDPTLGPEIVKQTRKQTIEKYTELSKIFPNIKDEIIAIYPSGDNHIIVEFKSSGKAADNTAFELPICTIFTIEKGLITKDFTYFDNFDEAVSDK